MPGCLCITYIMILIKVLLAKILCNAFAHHGLGPQPIVVTSRNETQCADALSI